MVRGGGLRMAEQRWRTVEVGAGVQSQKAIEGGGLEHPLENYVLVFDSMQNILYT